MASLPSGTKRTTLVRAEEPITEYGKPPEKRTIEEHISKGIVNIDKPPGPTSHQVSEWVKDILHVKKAATQVLWIQL